MLVYVILMEETLPKRKHPQKAVRLVGSRQTQRQGQGKDR